MEWKFNKFEIDHTIMFVIQHYLGESTEEILASFYETANTIVTQTLKVSRARCLEKKTQFMYKKSKMPITISIHSRWFTYVKPGESLPVDVEIKFTKKMLRVNPEDLASYASEKFEKTIGLRDDTTQLKNLENPEIKLPKVLKGVL